MSVTDASGLTTRTGLDAEGLLAGFQNVDRTQVGIDLGGDMLRLQSVTDPGGDITRFAYDALGNLLSTTLPDGATERFEYDANGRVTAATDANGQRVDLHLRRRRAWSRSAPSRAARRSTYTYDAHRNLLTATDAEGTTTFTYDAADRVTSVAYPNGKSVAITYDAAGRRATVADQTGYTVRYTYDSLGRLDQVRDTANALLVDYGYDALGQLASETRGNGSYDRLHLRRRRARRHASRIATRRTRRREVSPTPTTRTAACRPSRPTAGHDHLQLRPRRPAHPRRAARRAARITYTYDAEGNRTSVIDSAAGTESYATNDGDQYTTAGAETLTYDRDGRLITRTAGGVTTSYTTTRGPAHRHHRAGQRHHLSTTTRSAIASARPRTACAPTTRNDPAASAPSSANTTAPASTHYASGLGVAARESAGSTAFYHFDAARQHRARLRRGGRGASRPTTYLPFGEIAAQTGTLRAAVHLQRTVGVQDDPGDLFHMRARTYDAELGRFTTRDPIGFSGGDTNLYRFANNDPVNFSRPDVDPLSCLDDRGSLLDSDRHGRGGYAAGIGIAGTPTGIGAWRLGTGIASPERPGGDGLGGSATGISYAGRPPASVSVLPAGAARVSFSSIGSPINSVIPVRTPRSARGSVHYVFAQAGFSAEPAGMAGGISGFAGRRRWWRAFRPGSPGGIRRRLFGGDFRAVACGSRDGDGGPSPLAPVGHLGATAFTRSLGVPRSNRARSLNHNFIPVGDSITFPANVHPDRDGSTPEDSVENSKVPPREDPQHQPEYPNRDRISCRGPPCDPNNIIGPAARARMPLPAVIAPGQMRFDGFVGAGRRLRLPRRVRK